MRIVFFCAFSCERAWSGSGRCSGRLALLQWSLSHCRRVRERDCCYTAGLCCSVRCRGVLALQTRLCSIYSDHNESIQRNNVSAAAFFTRQRWASTSCEMEMTGPPPPNLPIPGRVSAPTCRLSAFDKYREATRAHRRSFRADARATKGARIPHLHAIDATCEDNIAHSVRNPQTNVRRAPARAH